MLVSCDNVTNCVSDFEMRPVALVMLLDFNYFLVIIFVVILSVYCKSIINYAQWRHLLLKKQCLLLLEVQSLLFVLESEAEGELVVVGHPKHRAAGTVSQIVKGKGKQRKKLYLLMFHFPTLVKQIHHCLEQPFLLEHVAWVSIVLDLSWSLVSTAHYVRVGSCTLWLSDGF